MEFLATRWVAYDKSSIMSFFINNTLTRLGLVVEAISGHVFNRH